MGQSRPRFRWLLSERVGARLSRRSPTPVLVVHDELSAEPRDGRLGRTQLRAA